MRVCNVVALVFLLSGAAIVSRADEQPRVSSGPPVGEKLPALKVTLSNGKDAAKTVDLIELAADRPTLLVIVNGTSRPIANLARCLMNFAELRSEKLFAGTVYLDNDQSGAARTLAQANSWWWVGPPIGMSVDGPDGPRSYPFVTLVRRRPNPRARGD